MQQIVAATGMNWLDTKCKCWLKMYIHKFGVLVEREGGKEVEIGRDIQMNTGHLAVNVTLMFPSPTFQKFL